MKYPMINKQPRREVNVPQLSGGLNLRDSLTGVRDNQMTDCINVWYKGGMLRTRPGFVTNEDMKIIKDTKYDKSYIANIKTHPDIRKDKATLVSALQLDGYEWDYRWDARILFWWQYDDKIEDAGSINITLESFTWENEESLLEALKVYSYFVSAKDGVAYCYASNGEVFYISKLEYGEGKTEWKEVVDEDAYVPTVYVHCKRSGWDEFEGTMFEGYNLITRKYKMIYSAYNTNDSDKSHPMRYKLGQKLPKSGEIKVEITTYDSKNEDIKTVEHCIEYSAEDYDSFSKGNVFVEKFDEGKESDDGLYLFVKYNYVGFLFEPEFTYTNGIANINSEELVKKYACNEDNIVITAPVEFDNKETKKVFNMSQSIWFGGTANGINGGSRLFLCGNTDENEKSLVVWSALNNPLYFPENNYAYVGDKSQAVTAFGQQGENLIIFKEKSTYYSYYAVNNITAEDLINQSVIDYESNSVYFPMVQLNANIGCDCPDTVQLCRNRLVWSNSDGNVYTLYSNNQYSERTIYKVSDMVNSALKKENDLKNAVSCDFEGHYLLCVGNKIYVMDYNSYGYQYASSFSKTEDSNVQIPWYIWEFDSSKYDGKIFVTNNKLMLINNFRTNESVILTFSIISVDEDVPSDKALIYDSEKSKLTLVENKINSRIWTKLFDFSSSGYLKNVDCVSMALGNNGGEAISVSFVTDKGSESEVVSLTGSSTKERDAAFVKVKNFYPCMRSIRTFGIKIECEGPLIVDGLSLHYRMLGGVK